MRIAFLVFSRTLALLLALCLAASPLCTSLCAARACSSADPANPATESCHHASARSNSPGVKSISPKTFCTNAEFLISSLRLEPHSVVSTLLAISPPLQFAVASSDHRKIDRVPPHLRQNASSSDVASPLRL